MAKVSEFLYTAVIPALGPATESMLWTIQGKTLIEISVELALNIREMQRVAVVTERENGIHETFRMKGIDIIVIPTQEHPINSQLFLLRSDFIGYVLHQIKGLRKEYLNDNGIIFLDPLCPLIRVEHVNGAIEEYQSQMGKPRPWMDVACFNEVSNHYHPKKILAIHGEGHLEYYDEKGRDIYQRQQLVGDHYFLRKSAIYITDPLKKRDVGKKNAHVIDHIINEPVFSVQKEHHLQLAAAMRELSFNGKQ